MSAKTQRRRFRKRHARRSVLVSAWARAPLWGRALLLLGGTWVGPQSPAGVIALPPPLSLCVTSTCWVGGPHRGRQECEKITRQSPSVKWKNVPEKARSLALMWESLGSDHRKVHWLLYHIPANLKELPPGLAPVARLSDPQGALQGLNSFWQLGFGGIAVETELIWHYRLLALSNLGPEAPGLNLDEFLSASRNQTLSAQEGSPVLCN